MLRAYLTGGLCLEGGDDVLEAREIPGRQGRALLAMLILSRSRPIPHHTLADDLWGPKTPPAAAAAIRALISKLRACLRRAFREPPLTITSSAGGYQVCAVRPPLVDVEIAALNVHEAEVLLAQDRFEPAAAAALVTSMITRRPFLPEVEGRWVDLQRERLTRLRVRALEVLASAWLARGDYGHAERDAEAIVRLDPYRETGYQKLMRAHTAAGNPALAAKVLRDCERLFERELGVRPSPLTLRVGQLTQEGTA